jgi:hypothetical protein
LGPVHNLYYVIPQDKYGGGKGGLEYGLDEVEDKNMVLLNNIKMWKGSSDILRNVDKIKSHRGIVYWERKQVCVFRTTQKAALSISMNS